MTTVADIMKFFFEGFEGFCGEKDEERRYVGWKKRRTK